MSNLTPEQINYLIPMQIPKQISVTSLYENLSLLTNLYNRACTMAIACGGVSPICCVQAF